MSFRLGSGSGLNRRLPTEPAAPTRHAPGTISVPMHPGGPISGEGCRHRAIEGKPASTTPHRPVIEAMEVQVAIVLDVMLMRVLALLAEVGVRHNSDPWRSDIIPPPTQDHTPPLPLRTPLRTPPAQRGTEP